MPRAKGSDFALSSHTGKGGGVASVGAGIDPLSFTLRMQGEETRSSALAVREELARCFKDNGASGISFVVG